MVVYVVVSAEIIMAAKTLRKTLKGELGNMLNYDMRDDLEPKRITAAMWDYSWLCCHYPGGSYEDYDKVTDELLERNFNTVRIDCYPAVIGMLGAMDEVITIRANPQWNWGPSQIDFKHSLINELIEFMSICKHKGIFVMLSTWNDGCVEYENVRDNYRNDPVRYFKAWEKTLDLLAERGLLDHVILVDLDQEFPYFSPFYAAIDGLGNAANSSTSGGNTDLAANMENAIKNVHMPSELAWNGRQTAFVYKHLKESFDHFHEKYPYLRFTFSLTSFMKEIRATGIKDMDVLELHLWMHGERFESRSRFYKIDKKRSMEIDYSDYQWRVDSTLKAVRPMLLHSVHQKLQAAMNWSEEISAPVITTEAWGPWWHMDHPDLTWGWLREWCAQCNELAGRYGLWGTTPWNYAHPYWDNWKDIGWYREVNGIFLKSQKEWMS